MKEFREFVSSLSNEVLNELDNKAMDQANDAFEAHKNDFDRIIHPIIHERYFNTYMTIGLLEKYHEWLSE